MSFLSTPRRNMTGINRSPHIQPASSTLPNAELRDFFGRLAAGDYHNLAKELNIAPRPILPPIHTPQDLVAVEDEGSPDPDISIQSIDSVESFKFQPTNEGLRRAFSLLQGADGQRPPTLEEEEAFQFTFRLMIHQLYSIQDFAQMVDDVVRSSQENFRPLSPAMTRRRRDSLAFSFAHSSTDADSHTSMASPRSPSDTSSLSLFPSSPTSSSWVQNLPGSPFDFESDDDEVRAVKKRIVGRKLSVVDGSADEETFEGPSWVYDAAVVSVVSPSSYRDLPSPPVAGSSIRAGFADFAGAYVSRKRRFSFLAARGF